MTSISGNNASHKEKVPRIDCPFFSIKSREASGGEIEIVRVREVAAELESE